MIIFRVKNCAENDFGIVILQKSVPEHQKHAHASFNQIIIGLLRKNV